MFGFTKKPNHDAQAKQLLQRAKIIAASSTVPVLDRFPAIDAIFRRPGFSVPGHWDFFITAAGLGTGLSLYAAQHTPDEMRPFAAALLRHMEHWDAQGGAAVADFQSFVSRNTDGGVEFATAIGSWVIWNIKGSTPTDSEFAAAPAIGTLVLNGVRDWTSS